jgi:hypothetical protein
MATMSDEGPAFDEIDHKRDRNTEGDVVPPEDTDV